MKRVFGVILTALFGISGWVMAGSSEFSVIQSIPALAPNLAGSETRLLPANYDIWAGEWSPNGKSFIFAGKVQGEDSTKMRIWLWRLDPTSDPVAFTNTDQLMDYSPRWSPDGTKVAITRRSFGKSGGAGTSAIWIKELASGAGKQITTGPEDRDPSWSPDGTQLVFSRSQGPYRSQLKVANLIDDTINTIAGEPGELLNSPWWGKDGKIYYVKLTPSTKNITVSGQVYQVMDFGRGSIWAYNPQENTIEPIVADEFDNRLPALSPDGNKLAFVSNRAPTKEGNGKFDRGSLYIKNLNTGTISYVTNKVGLVGGSLSWSPDGKKLAFFTFRSIRPAIWVINIP